MLRGGGNCYSSSYPGQPVPVGQHMVPVPGWVLEELERSNRIQTKLYNGSEVGILFKFVRYDQGYAFKFINDSDRYSLNEDLLFGLENCYVVGERGNNVRFTLGPRSV